MNIMYANTVNIYDSIKPTKDSKILSDVLSREWMEVVKKFIHRQEERNHAIDALLQLFMDIEVKENPDILPKIRELHSSNIFLLEKFKEVMEEDGQDEYDGDPGNNTGE